MANVYFSKDFEKILDKIDFSKLGNNVAIKVHFGERGNITYIDPKIVKKVYDKIIGLGKKATLVECNVLYKGSRTNSTSHIQVAKEHGFDFAPIDILDGELGDSYTEINVGGISNIAKLGKGISKYDSMIVMTHVKGHMAAGYGGAFKNIGMGLASRAGKLHMHAGVSPLINTTKCISCGKCIDNCPVKAISFENNKAKINPAICIGCAMCIAHCPSGAINIHWGAKTNEELCKMIVDYTYGILKIIPNTVYINCLTNITKECDCFGIIQKPIIPDIGFLYSDDIVAVDKASLDILDKESNGKFKEINEVNKDMQIDYAYSRKMGDKNYNLIKLE